MPGPGARATPTLTVTGMDVPAKAKGCAYQLGTDMLYEMIPAYLEFFGFGSATADELREVSQVRY